MADSIKTYLAEITAAAENRDFAKATQLWMSAKKEYPEAQELNEAYKNLMLNAGEGDEAAGVHQNVFQQAESRDETIDMIAEALFESGNIDQLLALMASIEESMVGSAAFFKWKYRALKAKGKRLDSLKAMARWQDLDPKNPDIVVLLQAEMDRVRTEEFGNGEIGDSEPKSNVRVRIQDPVEPLVTAIVSTYASERFIKGRLEDLLRQTIADKVEIVVIDSGSPENEGAIVKEFQKAYKNIKYVRTERETVYGAWNRGAKMARGKYLTNSNTDDRLRKDAFEVMVTELENHPEIGLVYADVMITKRENETFELNSAASRTLWAEHDRKDLFAGGCYVGPQPMWRRSIHDEYGYFDADFITSGDFEFWLRISETVEFKKIKQTLGLYLSSPTSVEHRNNTAKLIENNLLLKRYRPETTAKWRHITKPEVMETVEVLNALVAMQKEGRYSEALEGIEKALEKMPGQDELMYLKANIMYLTGDKERAAAAFKDVIAQNPSNTMAMNNLAVIQWTNGNHEAAIETQKKSVEADKMNLKALLNLSDMLLEKMRFSEAEEYLAKALALNPYNPMAVTEIAKIYLNSGQYIKALYHLDLGLTTSPDHKEMNELRSTLPTE